MILKIFRLCFLALILAACGLNSGDGNTTNNGPNRQAETEAIAASPTDRQPTEASQPLAEPDQQTEAPIDEIVEETVITIECPGEGLPDLSGQTLAQPSYANESLQCANFSGATLSQPDFALSDLSGASFVNATLSQPDIVETVFAGADFSGATMVGAEILNADFTGADFRNAILVNNNWFNTICPDGQNSDTQNGTCLENLDPLPVAINGGPIGSTSSSTELLPTAIVPMASSLTLGDEWFQDSNGNGIPNFIEIEIGYTPLIDNCAPAKCTAEIVDANPVAVQGENVLFILDASGSMAQGMGGQTRMDAAKEVLTNFVLTLPSTTKMGFMVYGHQGDNTEGGRPASCAGVELLAPVGQVAAETFPTLLNSFSPNGWTPIAGALTAAEEAFDTVEGGVNKVVLVTDGLETCGGDPVATASQLNLNQDIQLVIDVVGFSITNEGDRAALKQIAEAGGGVYHDVQSRDDFNNFVKSVLELARARVNYAACIGQEAVSSNTCYSNLILAANMEISNKILELVNDSEKDHEAEIAALEQIQEVIDIEEELRFEQYLEWELEHLDLLEEMEALDDMFNELFPDP